MKKIARKQQQNKDSQNGKKTSPKENEKDDSDSGTIYCDYVVPNPLFGEILRFSLPTKILRLGRNIAGSCYNSNKISQRLAIVVGFLIISSRLWEISIPISKGKHIILHN